MGIIGSKQASKPPREAPIDVEEFILQSILRNSYGEDVYSYDMFKRFMTEHFDQISEGPEEPSYIPLNIIASMYFVYLFEVLQVPKKEVMHFTHYVFQLVTKYVNDIEMNKHRFIKLLGYSTGSGVYKSYANVIVHGLRITKMPTFTIK
jgi:hypothetical protein